MLTNINIYKIILGKIQQYIFKKLKMKKSINKQPILLFFLIITTLTQLSSYVPSLLFNTPSAFISNVPLTQPLDAYVKFNPPSFKAVFGVDPGPRFPSNANKVCTFPFILLEGKCQCPRKLRFVFGKCIGARPQDYDGENVQPYPNGPFPPNNQGGNTFPPNNQGGNTFPPNNQGGPSNPPFNPVDPINPPGPLNPPFNPSGPLNPSNPTNPTNPTNPNNPIPVSNSNANPDLPLGQCPLLKINFIQSSQGIQGLALISRTYDGTNNNQNRPDWGSAGSLLERRVNNRYADGISAPITGLPSPRVISNEIGSQQNPIQTSRVSATIAFTIFGQFVDHDIDLTPVQRASSGRTPESLDIQIPANDRFFQNQQFIRFSRSQFIQDGSRSPRRHRNTITSWIDASQVYGSDNDTNCALRTFQNGKLKTSGQNKNFLPLLNNFFRAGDIRAIQNSILTTYQTIFLRQHNRVCDLVLARNPEFNDETVFQIARNFVIGLIQKITMKDFVRVLMGDSYDSVIGQYAGYNPSRNPNIPTEFSTASYRVGHSLLVNSIPSMDRAGRIIRNFRLNDLFFNQQIITQSFIGDIMRGASRTLTKQKSGQLVDDVRNLLVLNPTNASVKLDLFSLNIQRGRDHGLPTYNQARAVFGLPKINTFEQLLSPDQLFVANRLKAVYGNPDNLQLFVGIICQKPVRNGILGELGVQIVGQTFRNLRDGDRLWYQGVFPRSVVNEIDNTQIGDIVKRNCDAPDLRSDLFTWRT